MRTGTVASILTLALNPCIDVSSECDIVRPLHKIRTSNETYEPGGGGVNVARVVAELGGDVEVLCLAGGVTGALLDQLLGEIPIRRRIVPIAGNTRISLTVFERKTGNEFRFIPNGPRLTAAEVEASLAAARELSFDYLVASGSIPLGAPTDILARFAEIAAAKGARFVLDSSGAGLSVTLAKTPVYLVKPSLSELESLLGHRLDEESAKEAALDLVRRGRAEIVAVTMGAAGALLATRDRVIRLWSPKVESRSAVGAGDSFVGAMTLMLSRGRPIDDAVLFGIAAGAAAVLTPNAKLCSREDVYRLHDMMQRQQAAA
jgi:6-phosphofructokinase 2